MMTRTITLREFVLEELNRQLVEAGRDVRVVSERPKPTLVSNVVELRREEDTANQSRI
jgi:hypothetical protein